MWTYAVHMADALKCCHYGFSFIWNNGVHNNVTASLESRLLEQYQTVFARNLSYPAFTNFSLDSSYGNSDITAGDLSGCVNCGWKWHILADTNATWSVTFQNGQVTTKAITDVTIRNTQHFTPAAGISVKWSASTGQEGTAVVDSSGLVTVTGIELTGNTETTVIVHSGRPN